MDFESWLGRPPQDGQLPNAKSLELPLDLGMQNAGVPCAIHCTDGVPPNCASPALGFSGLPNFKPGQFKEPHGLGWFYCLPRFRQGPKLDATLFEKFLPKINLPVKVQSSARERSREDNTLIANGGHASKQFLVFDQTGNKTSLIFSSGISAPIQMLSGWSLKPTDYKDVSGDEVNIGSSGCYLSGVNSTKELDVDHGTDEESEMREDTEEINALLYSDDEENYSEDGEETSTGHSPSTMTDYEKGDWFEEDDMDEVASSAPPVNVKRQKLSDSGYGVLSVTNTSSSVEPNRYSEHADDAESTCGGNDLGPLSGNKRHRKEKIRETVNILQTIIPGGKGKDAVMVLDEAIDYLRTLKFKAKSLGL